MSLVCFNWYFSQPTIGHFYHWLFIPYEYPPIKKQTLDKLLILNNPATDFQLLCTIFRIKGLNNLLVKYGFSHSTKTIGRTTTHHLRHMTSLSNVCCNCGVVFGFRNSLFFLIYICVHG